MSDNNKELWANDRKMHDLKYPDENVIKFLFHNRSIAPGAKILDFGCGSGRNTRVMADLDFDIYAMDYNKECLDLTAQKLNGYGKVHYIQNDRLDIPLEDNSVDGIVAWGALFCLSAHEEEELFCNLVRVLKPGGLLLADYRAKEDSLYGCGTEIEKDFYILNDTCGSLSGITYAFRDMEQLQELYKKSGMTITNYEKINHYTENCKKCNSHYIIWSKKVEI